MLYNIISNIILLVISKFIHFMKLNFTFCATKKLLIICLMIILNLILNVDTEPFRFSILWVNQANIMPTDALAPYVKAKSCITMVLDMQYEHVLVIQ